MMANCDLEGNFEKFQSIAESVSVPFVEGRDVSPVEQIYILDKISGGWKIEVPELWDLIILANDVIIMLQPHDVFFEADVFLELDDINLNIYCGQHDLSALDINQVKRWWNWSRSAEARALEAHFRKLWTHSANAR